MRGRPNRFVIEYWSRGACWRVWDKTHSKWASEDCYKTKAPAKSLADMFNHLYNSTRLTKEA